MKNYFYSLFQGRLSRLQFVAAWVYYMLIFLSLMVIILAPIAALGTWIDSPDSQTSTFQYILIALIAIMFLLGYIIGMIIEVSLLIRRLHDINNSWWFIIFGIIPIMNLLFGLYILFMPGTPGTNNYGRRVKGYGWRTLLKLPKKKR